MKRLMAPLAVVAALGIAACGDDDENESGSAEPAVSFSTPAEGSSESNTVTAEVELENFELDPMNVGKAFEEGKGHLHFSLDGGKFDTPKYSGANGELAKQLGVDGQYSPSVEPTITYENLPPGEHTLEVDLAGNDHSDIGATASTACTVE